MKSPNPDLELCSQIASEGSVQNAAQASPKGKPELIFRSAQILTCAGQNLLSFYSGVTEASVEMAWPLLQTHIDIAMKSPGQLSFEEAHRGVYLFVTRGKDQGTRVAWKVVAAAHGYCRENETS